MAGSHLEVTWGNTGYKSSFVATKKRRSSSLFAYFGKLVGAFENETAILVHSQGATQKSAKGRLDLECEPFQTQKAGIGIIVLATARRVETWGLSTKEAFALAVKVGTPIGTPVEEGPYICIHLKEGLYE